MQKESNKDYYELQRSTDGGVSFSAFGSVNAQGESSLPLNYSFEDPNALVSAVHYRIKLVDLDNAFSYSQVIVVSPIIGLEDYVSVGTIIAANGNNTLLIDSEAPLNELKIYSLLGQEIFTKQLNGQKELTIDYSDFALPIGTYVLGLDDYLNHYKLNIR